MKRSKWPIGSGWVHVMSRDFKYFTTMLSSREALTEYIEKELNREDSQAELVTVLPTRDGYLLVGCTPQHSVRARAPAAHRAAAAGAEPPAGPRNPADPYERDLHWWSRSPEGQPRGPDGPAPRSAEGPPRTYGPSTRESGRAPARSREVDKSGRRGTQRFRLPDPDTHK
jgi:hypothetical protein